MMRQVLTLGFTVSLLWALAACEDGPEEVDGASTDADADSDSDNDVDVDVDGDGDGDDDDDNDTDTNDVSGCQGVDFLFVIDNSGSMLDEQKNLIASFPGFIEAITQVIEVDDYHIMVLDSDANYGSAKERQNVCDDTLGAGHVGQNMAVDCPIQGGNRYLIEDQPDLNGAFACIANVGINGNGYEKLMEAMANGVGPENGPGRCNQDFVRDDAILVVTFITDEDEQCTQLFEQCSAGDPASWKQSLIAAKNGNERAVVILGVFGDNDLADGICPEYDLMGNGAMPAPLLRAFIESFDEDRRQYCSVCLPSYAECFLKAVEIIDTTCEDMVIE